MPSDETPAREAAIPHSDGAFQDLLLQFSSAAVQGLDEPSLIRMFCRSSREFFAVDGTYFWQFEAPDQLVGLEADGLLAERFRGLRLGTDQASIGGEVIRTRQTTYANRLDPSRSVLSSIFDVKAALAAPLLVSNEVIGAAVFLHASNPDFFNDDLAAKATILAAQLGSLLEAVRLLRASREEQRRAEILAEVAQALHSVPDIAAVVSAVADRLRVLLRAPLVCVLLHQGASFGLSSVAAESPQAEASVRARHDRKGLQFAADLAARAVAAGEAVSVPIDPSRHSFGELIPAGMVIAIPLFTARTRGAILVYPRPDSPFTAEEKSLLSAVAGFGAVALANVELYATARAQAHELHQLLDIASELGSIGDLDQFMQQFALRAVDFLGFGRAFLGLLEEGVFRVRWGVDGGRTRSVDLVLPEGPVIQALLDREVFWSDEASKVPGIQPETLTQYKLRQVLTVPLLGSDGRVLGMFGVLDRLDGAGISQEDIRRAKVLAAQVAVALEVTRNLHLSEQHRQRAESLMGLALELNSLLRLPEFAQGFVSRAAAMMDAGAAALAVRQESGLETVVLQSGPGAISRDSAQLRRVSHGLSEALSRHSQSIVSAPAGELLGPDLASALGWSDCILVRLLEASGELVGVLCLANRGRAMSREDEQLLQAIASHASVALENARLFTRMEQANRHWVEIFDAISDFIVVHDEADNVLRVNRSLADFIGVPPAGTDRRQYVRLAGHGRHRAAAGLPFLPRSGRRCSTNTSIPCSERTYLVSTSRVHGASSEGLQTIHVLKDITDRREAERRYRELFDNIQEGPVFLHSRGPLSLKSTTPWFACSATAAGKKSLQVDIRTQVYLSPRTAPGIDRADASGTAGAQSRRSAPPQGWIDGPRVDQLPLRCAMRRQQGHAVSRPDARYQRPQGLSRPSCSESATSPARF